MRTLIPSQMQILGLMLSERSEGPSAEPSAFCSTLSVHLHFRKLLLYAVSICVLGLMPSIGSLSMIEGT